MTPNIRGSSENTNIPFLQLSKEDEAATGADEIEVRREDQDKINKFSRLHQREILVEEELKTKHVSLTYIYETYTYSVHPHSTDTLTIPYSAEGEGRP